MFYVLTNPFKTICDLCMLDTSEIVIVKLTHFLYLKYEEEKFIFC